MEEEVVFSDFVMTDKDKNELYSEGTNKEVGELMKGANWFGTWVGDDEVEAGSDIGSVEAQSGMFLSYSGSDKDANGPKKMAYCSRILRSSKLR